MDGYIEGKTNFLVASLRELGFSEDALGDIERWNRFLEAIANMQNRQHLPQGKLDSPMTISMKSKHGSKHMHNKRMQSAVWLFLVLVSSALAGIGRSFVTSPMSPMIRSRFARGKIGFTLSAYPGAVG